MIGLNLGSFTCTVTCKALYSLLLKHGILKKLLTSIAIFMSELNNGLVQIQTLDLSLVFRFKLG